MQVLNTLRSNPRKLFLIDGLGALLSSFLTGVVVAGFRDYFGIPLQAIYLLAVVPLFFAGYDTFCFLTYRGRPARRLQVIASLNILYCLLSFSIMVLYRESLTLLGYLHLIAEAVVVSFVAAFELSMARHYPPKRPL